ncbi:hypothetical protein M2281_002762 [Mesorhizobium soli]|uniref:hypothetical protein n=1 Tax=Pseudaminobacter soli (ex Li et al. 2025) TaxID=1295366 RepID=UPI0024748A56|nr:hypothetical protein [Mesorhizobium soli]MDH6232164.1 hypothetical protein [Mesorhizobium soli]
MGLSVERQRAARCPSPLPQPEEVFLSWLVAQPDGTNLMDAANTEIRRLDGYRGEHQGPRRLKELFVEFSLVLKAASGPRRLQ